MSVDTLLYEKDIMVLIIAATQLLCNYKGTWLDEVMSVKMMSVDMSWCLLTPYT